MILGIGENTLTRMMVAGVDAYVYRRGQRLLMAMMGAQSGCFHIYTTANGAMSVYGHFSSVGASQSWSFCDATWADGVYPIGFARANLEGAMKELSKPWFQVSCAVMAGLACGY